MDHTLTKDQQHVFNEAEQTDRNIFVTGKPGVGKSVLIHALTEFGAKHWTLGAPTGMAALNIGAKTLHSIFRIPVSEGILHPTFDNYTSDDSTVKFIKYRLTHLIIDEISMVRADMLDYINRLLKLVKQNDLPFGGIQLVIVGDFYQLPPVVKPLDKAQLKDAEYNSEFAFDSQAFKEGDFKIMELNEVLRQKGDDKFISILHSARTGDMSQDEINTLNRTVGKPKDLRIRLSSTNAIAEQINSSELAKLPGSPYRSYAEKFGQWPAFPAEEQLALKVGAQVIVKMNKADRPEGHKGPFESKVVNGTLGIVDRLPDDENASVGVKLENGQLVSIWRKQWERRIKQNEDGKWKEVVVATYSQIPLALAWAISIHKSQGQSYDKVHIDASKIFAAGQMYVALSRVRSLAGLSLEGRVYKQKFFANKAVTKFFESCKQH